MRVISTKTHGAIDYAPALLGISDEPAAARVLRAAGLAATAYSLLTDYEFGIVPTWRGEGFYPQGSGGRR
jgi:hypothetical protein